MTYSLPCAVAYTTDGVKYTRIKATSGSDGSYVYDMSALPENAQITVVVKGDANGDGKITLADSTLARAIFLGKREASEEACLAADANGSNSITLADSTLIRAAFLGKRTLEWS